MTESNKVNDGVFHIIQPTTVNRLSIVVLHHRPVSYGIVFTSDTEAETETQCTKYSNPNSLLLIGVRLKIVQTSL